MNKHGQALIMFVLLLPVIVLLGIYIVLSIQNNLLKTKLDGIVKSNMEVILKDEIRDTEEIKKIIKKNIDDVDIEMAIKDNEIIINTSVLQKNVWKKVFGSNTKINVCYMGNYLDKRINECG